MGNAQLAQDCTSVTLGRYYNKARMTILAVVCESSKWRIVRNKEDSHSCFQRLSCCRGPSSVHHHCCIAGMSVPLTYGLKVLCGDVQLEELSLTGEEHVNAWAVGAESVPDEWKALKNLRTLQLRGHTMLLVSALPVFLRMKQGAKCLYSSSPPHTDCCACRALSPA